MPAKAREGPAAFISERLAQAASSVFEAETEEDDVMHRPLRSPSKPVFSWPLLASGACYKVPSFSLSSPFFSSSPSTAACRNTRYGDRLLFARARHYRIAVILSSSLLWPAARDLFRFGSLHADDLAGTFAAGTVVLLVLELLKGVWPITGMGLRRGTGRS